LWSSTSPGDHRGCDERGLDHLPLAHREDAAEEEGVEVALEAGAPRHDDDADGEERGDQHGQDGVGIEARATRRQCEEHD